MSEDVGWPVQVDGRDYQPVPASWIDLGSDQNHGSPRLFAVSVAHSTWDLISLRFAARDGAVFRATMKEADNPTPDGTVPASLARYHDWPRSIVIAHDVEPVGVLRGPERQHLTDLWADRVDEISSADAQESEKRLVADSGREHPPVASGRVSHLDLSKRST